MKILMVISLFFFSTNALAFEHWEHKRMGDLAYYLAMEIHCIGKSVPPICKNMDREKHSEKTREELLEEMCEKRASPRTCELFDKIGVEKERANKDIDKLEKLLVDLRKECAEEINIEYCKKKIDILDNRWQSIFFYDPVYSGAQTDNNKKYTDDKISYGDVVGCVDYFLTPEKMLAGSETSLFKSLSRLKRHADPSRAIHLYPEQRGDLDLSVEKRCFEAIWNFEGDRAAHVNHAHFQSELILSQRNMHLLALSLRGSENNIFGALAANAISDHYLQDSFAPGHIVAWRSRLTDVAANAYHDKINREGAKVAIDAKLLAKMNGIKIDGMATTITDKVLERSDASTNPYTSNTVRQYFLLSGKKGRHDTCDGRTCASLSPAEQLQYMSNISKKLISSPEITFKGDDFLWDESQNQQRLLLLLIEVRSILDVLESGVEKDGNTDGVSHVKIVDSFKNSSWFWIEVEKSKKESTIAFVKPSQLTATIGPVTYQVENSPKIYGYDKTDPIYGVSIGFDDMLFGDQQNRSTILFERLLLGNANEKRDAINLALVAGAHASHSRFGNDVGLSIRGAIVLPQTETIISIPVRYVRMHDGPGKTWRPTVGLRIDQGFSSFSTFYLQVTRDSTTQRDGSIRSGLSIGAGLGFAAPECRIPGLKSILACH